MTGTFMRKALVPMLASLALCGAATAALIVTTARAQPEARKPMMVALVTPGMTAAPATEGGSPPAPGRGMPTPAQMQARFKQMCQDHYARHAAELAYTEAKLGLTAAEQPLFARWKQVKLDIAKRRADACASHVRPMNANANAKMPTLIDRMARHEDMLKQRLADLDAERPVLEAFYNSLSADQKREFARGLHGPGMDHRRFAGGMMGPGMMGRGMMGHGMMGPGMMHRGPMGMPPGPPPGDGSLPGMPGEGPPAPPPQ